MSQAAPIIDQVQLEVLILSPTEQLYEGPAISVSANNKVGPFDVLGGHASMFTILLPPQITVNTGEKTLMFPISQGVMKVHDNHVEVYVGIETVRPNSGDSAELLTAD